MNTTVGASPLEFLAAYALVLGIGVVLGYGLALRRAPLH